MAEIPRAEWLERFASKTLNLIPGAQPLDAVREALDAFPVVGDLKPEHAAEVLFAADQLMMHRIKETS